jgi:hypothetical protein
MSECDGFGNLGVVQFQNPPEMKTVPTYRWIMSVYCKDIVQHIDEVKAKITSVFGKILKLDSTRKVNVLCLDFKYNYLKNNFHIYSNLCCVLI